MIRVDEKFKDSNNEKITDDKPKDEGKTISNIKKSKAVESKKEKSHRS